MTNYKMLSQKRKKNNIKIDQMTPPTLLQTFFFQ